MNNKRLVDGKCYKQVNVNNKYTKKQGCKTENVEKSERKRSSESGNREVDSVEIHRNRTPKKFPLE